MFSRQRTITIAGIMAIAIALLYYRHYTLLHAVLNIKGDIVDERGNPLDTGVAVTEGQFISITKNSYRTYFEATPNGRFNITTSPAYSVNLEFGHKGYIEEHRSYGKMSDVPKPLHIVMHKITSASATTQVSPVGLYEAKSARGSIYGSYVTVRLDLYADGTAATVTTLPDNLTKVKGEGIWSQTGQMMTRRIIISIRQENGSPDPAALCGKSIVLIPLENGERLYQSRGGSEFRRVK
jgi:hypothetical protein